MPALGWRTPISERFWKKVEKTESCWLWTASKDKRGYGHIKGDGPKLHLAHRLSYEWAYGPITEGMEIDHLCRVTNCVNPEHLEEVTPLENMRRRKDVKTHCPQGHEYTEDNSMYDSRGYRLCRTCRSAIDRVGKRRRRAAKKAKEQSCMD